MVTALLNCENISNRRHKETENGFWGETKSRFFDFKNGKATDKKAFVSAKIAPATGGLVVEPAQVGKYDSRSLGTGVYHMFDLNFFYYDLRINGKVRSSAFRKWFSYSAEIAEKLSARILIGAILCMFLVNKMLLYKLFSSEFLLDKLDYGWYIVRDCS